MTQEPPPCATPTLFILRGISGSGKSTVARRIQERIGKTIVVSRDDLRLAFYNKDFGPPIDENFITQVENSILRRALEEGISAISDNTNLYPQIIRNRILLAQELGAHVILQEIEVPLHLAKFHNADRHLRGGRYVPEDVITLQHETFYRHQDEVHAIYTRLTGKTLDLVE